MLKSNFRCLLIAAVGLCTSCAAFGQFENQVRARQLPGWNVRAREGRCTVRVWVDNRAEVRMRGDSIFMRTMEGSRSRDEGTECSQPLPFNSVAAFQVRQTAGRSRLTLGQEPSKANNFTATIVIEDKQGGGDAYAFEVTWRAEADVAAAPAPFFDEVRACQDVVRQRFVTQNGRGSYIDFDQFADRQGRAQDNWRATGQYRGNAKGNRNNTQESIQGRGSARRRNETRDLTYSCMIDTRQNEVVSGTYQYTGDSLRTEDRYADRRQLR